jgi:hypothetical protein
MSAADWTRSCFRLDAVVRVEVHETAAADDLRKLVAALSRRLLSP